jgi:hypothetical protein
MDKFRRRVEINAFHILRGACSSSSAIWFEEFDSDCATEKANLNSSGNALFRAAAKYSKPSDKKRNEDTRISDDCTTAHTSN